MCVTKSGLSSGTSGLNSLAFLDVFVIQGHVWFSDVEFLSLLEHLVLEEFRQRFPSALISFTNWNLF